MENNSWNVFGVLLSDLSKSFDYLLHELIIGKLNAYGFSLLFIKLIQSYLSHTLLRTEINDSYCSWSEIHFGLPQGSILGPILFNILLNILFLVIKDVNLASYADDAVYDSGGSIESDITSLQDSAKKLFLWVSEN